MTELETLKRAKMYMDKLAQGIDPITDTEIDGDSCLNNVRLARCFFYISGVLDRLIARGGVESKPKKMDFSTIQALNKHKIGFLQHLFPLFYLRQNVSNGQFSTNNHEMPRNSRP